MTTSPLQKSLPGPSGLGPRPRHRRGLFGGSVGISLLLVGAVLLYAMRFGVLPQMAWLEGRTPQTEAQPTGGSSSWLSDDPALKAEITTLLGVVLDENGAPLPRAKVEATRVAAVGAKTRRPRVAGLAVQTTADGQFELELDRIIEETTRIVCRVSLPGRADAWQRGLWQVANGTLLDMGEIVLRPGRVVRGRVLDPEGLPVAESVVVIHRTGRTVRDLVALHGRVPPPGVFVARTDQLGRYEVRLPMDEANGDDAGRYVVAATRVDRTIARMEQAFEVAASGAPNSGAPDSGALDLGALELRPATSITGVLSSAVPEIEGATSDSPLKGIAPEADLVAMDNEKADAVAPEPVADARILIERIGGATDDRQLVFTGSDGLFIARHLEPTAEYMLWITADGYERTRIGPVRPAPGNATLLDIDLRSARALAGIATDAETDEPIERGVRVVAIEGSLEQVLEPDLAEELREDLQKLLRQETRDAGLPGLIDTAPNKGAKPRRTRGGRFSTGAPADRTVTLAVSAPGYVTRMIGPLAPATSEQGYDDERPTEEAATLGRIALTPLIEMRGTVLSDGGPIAGATISLGVDLGSVRRTFAEFADEHELSADTRTAIERALSVGCAPRPATTTDADGQFTLRCPPDRDLLLLVRSDGIETARHRFHSPTAAATARREPGRVDFELRVQRGASLRGTVAGLPIGASGGELVVALRSPVRPSIVAELVIDPEAGRTTFAVPQIEPGRYWLQITPRAAGADAWLDLFTAALARRPRAAPAIEIARGTAHTLDVDAGRAGGRSMIEVRIAREIPATARLVLTEAGESGASFEAPATATRIAFLWPGSFRLQLVDDARVLATAEFEQTADSDGATVVELR